MTSQNRRLEFNVSETEEEILGSISTYLVREILEQAQKNKIKMNIVVPAGKTADKFYEKFTEEKRYLLFHEDRTMLMYIGKWFRKNQGRLLLEDLVKRLEERFGFVATTIYTEEEMSKMEKILPHLKNQAYILEEGIVYQNQRCQSLEASPNLSFGF